MLVAIACAGCVDWAAAAGPERFAARADELCAVARAEVEALEHPAEPSLAANAAWLREVVRVNRRLLQRLRAVEPPQADREVVAGILDAVAGSVAALDQAAQAAADSDQPRFDQATWRFQALAGRAGEQAAAYGLGECFRGP